MKERIFKPFFLTLETLSPLHIGSGGKLRLEIDYLQSKNQVLVMNSDKVLEVAGERLLKTKEYHLSKILQPHQYEECTLYKAALKTERTPPYILEFIKDINWKPFLPGSSLKGAFRTVLACGAYQGPLSNYYLNPKPEKADDNIEGKLFGSTPHEDILRALKVKDCYLKKPTPMEVVEVGIYSVGREGLQFRQRLFVEAVLRGTIFEGEMVIEEFLFTTEAERELGFSQRPVKLHLLCEYGRQMAERIITSEKIFYRNVGRRDMISFYERLAQKLSESLPNQFLLQIGWGTGWQSKTIGSKLPEQEIDEVVDKYFKRKPKGIFPSSRRLIEYPGEGLLPLGWVKVTLEG